MSLNLRSLVFMVSIVCLAIGHFIGYNVGKHVGKARGNPPTEIWEIDHEATSPEYHGHSRDRAFVIKSGSAVRLIGMEDIFIYPPSDSNAQLFVNTKYLRYVGRVNEKDGYYIPIKPPM